jgi:hypothetical protein
MSADIQVTRKLGGDGYWVRVDGVIVGEVYRARCRSDRYPHGDPSYRGRGRTRWYASPGVTDEDFGTRREAVAELVRRAELLKRTPDHASLDITGDFDIRCEFAPDVWRPTIEFGGDETATWGRILAMNVDGTWFEVLADDDVERTDVPIVWGANGVVRIDVEGSQQ